MIDKGEGQQQRKKLHQHIYVNCFLKVRLTALQIYLFMPLLQMRKPVLRKLSNLINSTRQTAASVCRQYGLDRTPMQTSKEEARVAIFQFYSKLMCFVDG